MLDFLKWYCIIVW